MSERRRVLVLRPAKERESSLRTLLRTGAEIVAADHPSNDLVGLADVHLPLPDVAEVFRRGDEAGIEARLQAHHDDHPFSGIVVHYDYLLPLVGRLNERWGLRGHTEQSGIACSNKRRQRIALAANGVPQPRWTPLDRGSVPREARAWGWPLVVKPADRAASCAVSIVHGPEQLDAAVDAAQAESWAGDVLVEEYLDGPEFSVESIVVAGQVCTLAVTAKGIGGRTGVLETEAEMPAPIVEEDRRAVVEVAAAAVRACGLQDGPAHTEIRLTATGAQVVEVNGRVGGLFLSDMVRAVTGIDLYRAWFDVLHDERADVEPQRLGVAMFRTLTDLSGHVTAVDVAELSAWARARLLVARSFVRAGDDLAPIANGNEIRGVVASFAADRTEARAALEEIGRAVEIRSSGQARAGGSPGREPSS